MKKQSTEGDNLPLYPNKHRTPSEFRLQKADCYPVSKLPSLTVKGHSYTIQELLDRHTMGIPLNIKGEYEGFADSTSDPDIIKEMSGDIYDVDQFKKRQAKHMETLQTKTKADRSAASTGGVDNQKSE